MSEPLIVVQHRAICGTLDADRKCVTLANTPPPHHRMRRLLLDGTYELWETAQNTPVQVGKRDPYDFSALMWLVEIEITHTVVSGYLLQSAIVSPTNIAAIMEHFLHCMSLERS